MTVLALAAVAGAVLLIRLGWGGTKRAAAAGWTLAAAALLWLAWRDGAWGLSVGLVAGSLAALALVAQAGAVSPRRPRRARAEAAATATAARDLAIGRRLLVFVLVVPVSFLAAQALAFAIAVAMTGAAPLEANGVATALLVQPLVWTALMAWQMTMAAAARMALPPALVAAAAAVIWGLA